MFQIGIGFIYLANWLFAIKYLTVSLEMESTFTRKTHTAHCLLSVLFWSMMLVIVVCAVINLVVNTITDNYVQFQFAPPKWSVGLFAFQLLFPPYTTFLVQCEAYRRLFKFQN